MSIGEKRNIFSDKITKGDIIWNGRKREEIIKSDEGENYYFYQAGGGAVGGSAFGGVVHVFGSAGQDLYYIYGL